MKIKTSQSSCSVQNWLDQSLEKRGIDANVYGKYILSLVTDSDDDNDHQDNDLTFCTNENVSGLNTDVSGSSKYNLVIECLQNVCQAPNDAEAFVRELILLMKQQQDPQPDEAEVNKRISCDWRTEKSITSALIPDHSELNDDSCVVVADHKSGSNVPLFDQLPADARDDEEAVISESDETERLVRKFNRQVASIWQTERPDDRLSDDGPVGQDVWGPSANIWSFDPFSLFGCGTRSPDVNETSLLNHTTDSLFVPLVRPLTAGSAASSSKSSSSSSSRTHPALERTISQTENLLTSAATHFQPIRQDYYERAGNIVTDASICGLVPCSGKCPNHFRNRTEVRKEDDTQRPASTSLNELSLFVGPFTGDDKVAPVSNSADKSTDTSDDVLPYEEYVSRQTAIIVDDYDAICSILNDVLSRRDEEDEPAPATRSIPSAERIPVSVYESLFVDPDDPGYMYSQQPGTSLFPQLSHTADDHRHEEADSRNRLFRTSAVPTAVRRSSRSPVATGRHFVIEPKIERNSEYQKPCSFFLEGNCRKVDCKFSHDLSRIVCKFWMEGFCFKGNHCPFRHSVSEISDDDMNLPVDRSSFTIESENDFPSLAIEEKKVTAGTKKVAPLGQRKVEPANGQKAASVKQIHKLSATKRCSPNVLFRAQVGKAGKKKKSQQKGL